MTQVLGFSEVYVETVVKEMMEDKLYSNMKCQRKKFCQGKIPDDQLPTDILALPPFPYKIVKALYPGFYRNVVLDTFLIDVPPVKNETKTEFEKKRRLKTFQKSPRNQTGSSSDPSPSASTSVSFSFEPPSQELRR